MLTIVLERFAYYLLLGLNLLFLLRLVEPGRVLDAKLSAFVGRLRGFKALWFVFFWPIFLLLSGSRRIASESPKVFRRSWWRPAKGLHEQIVCGNETLSWTVPSAPTIAEIKSKRAVALVLLIFSLFILICLLLDALFDFPDTRLEMLATGALLALPVMAFVICLGFGIFPRGLIVLCAEGIQLPKLSWSISYSSLSKVEIFRHSIAKRFFVLRLVFREEQRVLVPDIPIDPSVSVEDIHLFLNKHGVDTHIQKDELGDLLDNVYGSCQGVSKKDLGAAFEGAGWEARKCTWVDYEVTSDFAELVIEAEDFDCLVHGLVKDVDANLPAVTSVLDKAASSDWSIEVYDDQRNLIRTITKEKG